MKSAEPAPSIASHKAAYPVAFLTAIDAVLANEGGFCDDPKDAGGATNYGISQRQYPALAIRTLTREAAMAIYHRDWWERFGYGDLPKLIGAKLFDLAVNIGPDQAAKCLQRALRACGDDPGEDGVLGAGTRGAARAAEEVALLAALRCEAAGHYRLVAQSGDRGGAGEGSRFLKGWLRRAYQ